MFLVIFDDNSRKLVDCESEALALDNVKRIELLGGGA